MITKFHRKPATFVNHVSLNVQHLKRSIEFYTEVIGFSVLTQSEKKAELTADGKNIILTLHQPENVIPRKGRTTGLYHFAILLPTRKDLARAITHFRKIGLPIASGDHLVSEAFYFSDPDGNGIEIYADRPSETWEQVDGQIMMDTLHVNIPNLLSEDTKEPWVKAPSDTIIGHIHLHVANLKQSKAFYCEGLGFQVVNSILPQALFLSTSGYHHHIGLNTWNGEGAPAPAANSVGLSSYTLVFDTKEQLHHVISKLKNLGATVLEHEYSYLTHDPSGNRIVLQV